MFKKKAAPVLLILAIFAGAFSPLFGINKALAVDMGNVFPDQNGAAGGAGYTIGDQYVKIAIDPNFTTTTTKAQFVATIKLSNLSAAANPANDTSNSGTNANFFDAGDDYGDWTSILDTNIENTTSNGIFIEVGHITTDNNIPDSLNGTTTDGVNFTAHDPVNQTLPTEYAIGNGSGGSIKKINIGYYIWRKSPPQTYFFGKTDFSVRIPVQGLSAGQLYYARIYTSEDASTDTAQSKLIKFTTPTVDPTLIQNQDGGVFDASTNAAAQAGQFADLLDCGINPWTWGGCIVLWIYDTLYYASYLFLWLCGYIMDAFIGLSISSKVYVDSTFVVAGWSVVRDLANIFLIFILIYIAIGTILKMERVHANKMLPAVIIIGLLLNFSLFFSRVIIDLGNSLAHVFYSEIKISGSQDESILKDDNATSLSSSLAKGFELSNIFSGDAYDKMANGGEKPGAGTMFFVVILGIIVNFVAAWTFLKCGLFFLGRILGLWFSMIFAPIAFVSSIVKETSGVLKQMGWQQWIDNLIKLSLMAPLFLLFMYLVLLLLQSNFMDGFINDKNSYDWIPFMTIIIMNFMLIIGLVNAAKGIAEDLSGSFGKQVAGVIGTALAVGVGATAIAGGAAARGLIRNPLQMATNDKAREASLEKYRSKGVLGKTWGFISNGKYRSAALADTAVNRGGQTTWAGKAAAFTVGRAAQPFAKATKDFDEAKHHIHESDETFKPTMEKMVKNNEIPEGYAFKDLSVAQKTAVTDQYNKDFKDTKLDEIAKKLYGVDAVGKLAVGSPERLHVEHEFDRRQDVAKDPTDPEYKKYKSYRSGEIMRDQLEHGVQSLGPTSITDWRGMLKTTAGRAGMEAKSGSWDPRNLEKSSFKLLAASGMLMAASMKQMTGMHYGTSEKNFGKDLLGVLKNAGANLQKAADIKVDPGHGGGGHGGGDHGGGHGKKDDHGGGHH